MKDGTLTQISAFAWSLTVTQGSLDVNQISVNNMYVRGNFVLNAGDTIILK